MDSRSLPIVVGTLLIVAVCGVVYSGSRSKVALPAEPVPVVTQESTTTDVSTSTVATSTVQ